MRYAQIHTQLTEATREYVEKIVDPALMTASEYRAMVDPSYKSHPSHAYDVSVSGINTYDSAGKYPKTLNNIRVNGIDFLVAQQTIDRWDNSYVKTTANGEIVRDKNGKAQYLSPAEIQAMIPENSRYKYEYAIIEKNTKNIVARTSDEWGTLLVQTASEYRGFGFGTLLVKLKREHEPAKPSGGFTPAGLQNFRRVHARMVRDYASSGFYSLLVKNGTLTAERAKTIINSVQKKSDKKTKLNLDTSNPEHWLLLVDENASYAILYDRKIYELPSEYLDTSNHWAERMIIGMVAIGGNKKQHINRTHGDTRIVSFLLEVILNGVINDTIILEPHTYKLVARLEPKLISKRIKDDAGGGMPRTQYQCRLSTPTLNWKGMSNSEKRYRKQRDPWSEMYSRILELAEGLTE